MRKFSIILFFLVFFSLNFFGPEKAYAQTASSSADCSPIDVGCQVCWLFCFPSTFAEDEYSTLKGDIDAKAPFAYVNAALAFNTDMHNFSISRLEPIVGPGYNVFLVNEPTDVSTVTQCSVYVNYDGTFHNEGTSAYSTGIPDPFCEVFWPINTAHDHVYVTLENSSGDILYTTDHWPDVVGTAGPSNTVLPLTITIASMSAIPEIGMPAQTGVTYTVTDDGSIHTFLFTYERPLVTLLLWVILIAYFWIVARRVFI